MTKRTMAIVIVAIFVATSGAAATVRETFLKTYDATPGGEIALWNTNGSITIESWDRSEVRIEAKKEVKASSRDRANEALKKIRIVVEASPSRIAVSTETPKGSDGFFAWLSGNNIDYSVTYLINVPRDFDLDIETTNGGIETSETRGRSDLATTNGKIRVFDSAGSIDASTTNGSIEAELREVDTKSMKLGTTNGRITVRLPEGIAADIDASTTNGSIESDFPVTTTKFRRTRLEGSINGGGPTLRLRTTNGSIRIERLD